jgi:hypothetical protein
MFKGSKYVYVSGAEVYKEVEKDLLEQKDILIIVSTIIIYDGIRLRDWVFSPDIFFCTNVTSMDIIGKNKKSSFPIFILGLKPFGVLFDVCIWVGEK